MDQSVRFWVIIMGHYNLTKMPKSFVFANNSIQNCHSRENILCVFLNMIMAV